MQAASLGINRPWRSQALVASHRLHVPFRSRTLASARRQQPCWGEAFCRLTLTFVPVVLVKRGSRRRSEGSKELRRTACSASSSPQGQEARFQLVQGVSDIASRYDAFLVDLWGVIHNGKAAFPWAIRTLQKLRELGKPVVFLSNSSRRREINTKALQRFGLSRDLYLECITSGEETWKALSGSSESSAARHLPKSVLQAKKLVLFGNGDDDGEFMESLPGRSLADVQGAELLLARGCFSLGVGGSLARADWEEFETTLAAAADLQVPMLVANPDIVRPDGNNSPMPGRLARRYVQLGGPTPYFIGKPYSAVFEEAYRLLQGEMGADFAASKVCMIGDSVWHDVQGASRMGLDVLFLCTGIHSQALGLEQAPATPKSPSDERLTAFLGALPPGEGPTYVAPAFAWDNQLT
mmetsp:Transcript_18912/g.34171  ORF Transcript_18912/g.34171 Transcript_18912/m.34171 type:complete len:410 (-) Transcript_18912:119-1348(-)